MSCFIVSTECMQKVLNMAFWLGDKGKLKTLSTVPVTGDDQTAFLAGRKLWEFLYYVNQRAFLGRYEGRYQDDAELPPFSYVHLTRAQRAALSPDALVACAKAIESLTYQCAEDPVVSDPIYAELEALRDLAYNEVNLATGARSNVKNTAAWERAEWG